MTNVLPLPRQAQAPAAEPQPAHRRIRLGSRALIVLFTVLAAGLVLEMALAAVMLLAWPNDLVRIGASGTFLVYSGAAPADTVVLWSLPFAHRLAFLPVILVRLAPRLALLWGLRRLFSLYARGIVFARENARQISFIGIWLVIDALVPFGLHIVQQLTGIEIDRQWFHLVGLQELVLGALVFVIAEVMRVGHEIEQERAEFI